jgi:type IV pilus assembly protein PilB
MQTPAFGENSSLAKILLKNKLITEEVAKKIELDQIKSGKTQEEIIRENKLISENDLLSAKAEYLKLPFVDLDQTAFEPQSITLVPESVAQHYSLVPYDLDEGNKILKVAMVNPLDLETIEFLEKKTGYKVAPALANPAQIKGAIKSRYGQEITDEVAKALGESTAQQTQKIVDIHELDKVIREAPIAQVVSKILEFALKSRSSDVHIEPQEGDTRVRYRVDGILQEKLNLPKRVHDSVISRIKILAGLKIDERRVPQDGRFTFTADGEEVDLRVSSAPTVYGEKIVMRLLKKTQKIPTLQELGLRGKALRDVEESVSRPHGMIVVCGPTGSGKTTTLYSILSKVNTAKVNTMTVEDPVEYKIEGVNQVQVNPQAGLTFSSALRSFLRQDPDIIMVGEIRDQETAQLAVQAALTGHLVFSTLHTNDVSGASPRLVDMGVESFLLVSALNAFLAQRVVRRICEHCKESYKPSEDVAQDIRKVLGNLIDPNKEITLYKGKGCKECNDTGYYGRIGIYEVMPNTEKLTQLIIENSSADKIRDNAIAEGMITMLQDGYLKATEGITTIEEVLRVAKY